MADSSHPEDEYLKAEDVKSRSEMAPPESAAASVTGAALAAEHQGTGPKIGNYRWVICALLFFATTINYMDRFVLGILAKTLETEIGWTKEQYGYINSGFQFAYAFGLLIIGRFIDRIGTRRGFSIAIVVWSIAGMAHAL